MSDVGYCGGGGGDQAGGNGDEAFYVYVQIDT